MKERLAMRIESSLNDEIQAITDLHNVRLPIGRVTKTDVVKMLIERGIESWHAEQCEHKNVDREEGLDHTAAPLTWYVCRECGARVGAIT